MELLILYYLFSSLCVWRYTSCHVESKIELIFSIIISILFGWALLPLLVGVMLYEIRDKNNE